MQENNTVTNKNLDTLKKEVIDLKNSTSIAIESFEKSLQELSVLPSLLDLDWSSDLDGIEVFTMEEPPALSESIRKIMI